MVGAMGAAVSSGSSRTRRRVTGLHVSGLLLGALFFCSLLALIGSVGPGSVVAAGVVIVSLALVVWQLAGHKPLQSHWQVPEHWRHSLDLDVLSVSYGFLLGFGVFTAVVTSAFWVFVGLTALVPAPLAYIGWTVYAVTRGGGFVLMALVGGADAFGTTRHHRSVITLSGVLAMVAAALQL